MMEVEQVWEAIDAAARPLPTLSVPIEEALGLVLAEAVRAVEDMPPFDRAAMDGYVVGEGDASSSFHVVDEIRAGGVPRGLPGVGRAARIFTGGPVPAGACVVMQEHVSRQGNLLRLLRSPDRDHVRRQGSDVRRGEVLLGAGARLGPGELAILAAAGHGQPLVRPRPTVAHVVTGDELVGSGEVPGPGQVRDSNGPLVRGLLAESGIRKVACARWSDDRAAFGSGLSSAPIAGADLLLISGGAGGGDYDFTRAALEQAGFEIHCSRVNSRPGRPLLFGSSGRRLAFGLPGNPLSHFVVFHLFVARALARMCGRTPPAFHRACLGEELALGEGKGPTFRPCRLRLEGGRLRVAPISWNNSGHVSALVGATGLLRAGPGEGRLSLGVEVDVLISGNLP